MSESVLVALLSLLGTLAGAFGGIIVANKLVNYRLQQLEIKVDKHNSVIDRMYCAERQLVVLSEQVKMTNHRIEDLEQLEC